MKILKFIVAIPSTLIYLIFSGIIFTWVIFGSITETEDNIPIIPTLKFLSVALIILFSSSILMLWGLGKIRQWLYSFTLIVIPFGLFTCSLLNITKHIGIVFTFTIVIAIFLVILFSVKKYYKN